MGLPEPQSPLPRAHTLSLGIAVPVDESESRSQSLSSLSMPLSVTPDDHLEDPETPHTWPVPEPVIDADLLVEQQLAKRMGSGQTRQ